jgi:hypothetical protein
MQQTTGVAVLATHLAHTDRRALSQAWYSALHLAGRTPVPQRAAFAPSASMRPSARAATAALPRSCTAPHACAERSLEHANARNRDANAVAAERRAPTELGRRIERALTQHATRMPRGGAASFTVSAGSGRVHVIVRSDGARTRVVAVCAPPLRERVERALAHARFALAGRGVRAEVA